MKYAYLQILQSWSLPQFYGSKAVARNSNIHRSIYRSERSASSESIYIQMDVLEVIWSTST
jgi:hypothetical protein